MRTQFSKFALAAAFGLALAFTLSCSSDKDDDPSPQPLPVSSGGNSGVDGSSSSVTTGSGNGSSSSATSGGGSSSSATASGGSSSSATGSVGTSSSAGGGAASETVVIGGKTWQAKNLSVDVPGSKCYAEGVSGVSADSVAKNCAKYGRLYNWATAMSLPSKCNSTLSTSDTDCAIGTPNHRGICPAGWHIPSNADWDALYRSADGTSGTNSPYSSPTAGPHLKAKEGWNDCGPSGSGKTYSCEDTYNFSALPGGLGNSNGDFGNAGDDGYWWSASEDNSNYAYYRGMYYLSENAFYNNVAKSYLFSVRCLQD